MSRSTDINSCYVCVNLSCAEAGSQKLVDALEERLADSNVDVRTHICFGACWMGPNIVLYPEGTWYSNVAESDVDDIVTHVKGGPPVARLLSGTDESHHKLVLEILEAMIGT
ncbi:MAG: NADP-reducing hydrogenase subunit HndC [Chloroflexota bacterium]|jgi:(2Fe-2S) ferredoxin|nr:NADP-reducing hydrogenase subunit HndC [Chloroflexota bacterium]